MTIESCGCESEPHTCESETEQKLKEARAEIERLTKLNAVAQELEVKRVALIERLSANRVVAERERDEALGEISRMTMRPAAEVIEAERARIARLDEIAAERNTACAERDAYRSMLCDLVADRKRAIEGNHATWARAHELLKNGPVL